MDSKRTNTIYTMTPCLDVPFNEPPQNDAVYLQPGSSSESLEVNANPASTTSNNGDHYENRENPQLRFSIGINVKVKSLINFFSNHNFHAKPAEPNNSASVTPPDLPPATFVDPDGKIIRLDNETPTLGIFNSETDAGKVQVGGHAFTGKGAEEIPTRISTLEKTAAPHEEHAPTKVFEITPGDGQWVRMSDGKALGSNSDEMK